MSIYEEIELELGATRRDETLIARQESREIGQRVRAELERQPISQAALARRMDLSPGQLSKMLRGGRSFSLEHVIRAADALDCPVARITPDDGRIAVLLERYRARNEEAVGTGCARGALIVATKRVADMTPEERMAALSQVEQLRAALLATTGLDGAAADVPRVLADDMATRPTVSTGDPDDYELS